MTKVLFICGSLEPEHDGVGDYTRSLAGALQKKGLDTRIIAIRDKKTENVLEEIQLFSEQEFKVVRISKFLSFRKRREVYQQLIADYNPDWISLQYVPYAFSLKGIPISLPRLLNLGSNSIKWHFMIHEVHIAGQLNFKDRLIKKIQIVVLKLLQFKLRPKILHTSTPQYQSYLNAIGLKSKILGLFGNIPISKLENYKVNDDVFRGVYFGASPKLNNIHFFIEPLQRYLDETHGRLEVVLCGQSGEKGRQFANLLRAALNSNRCEIREEGRMSAEELSELFLQMDFGIARVPPQLIGKSGSAIALLEHGLPLWIPLAQSNDDIKSHIDFRTTQCFDNLIELRESKLSFPSGSRLEEIADSFIESLNFHKNQLK